jgi:hypothetical protein
MPGLFDHQVPRRLILGHIDLRKFQILRFEVLFYRTAATTSWYGIDHDITFVAPHVPDERLAAGEDLVLPEPPGIFPVIILVVFLSRVEIRVGRISVAMVFAKMPESFSFFSESSASLFWSSSW